MTAELAPSIESGPARDVEWRRLGRRLWVARGPGGYLGMVEHGRGYTAIDCDDVVRGRFRTIAQAKDALVGPRPPASARPIRKQGRTPTAFAATGALAVATASFVAYQVMLHL